MCGQGPFPPPPSASLSHPSLPGPWSTASLQINARWRRLPAEPPRRPVDDSWGLFFPRPLTTALPPPHCFQVFGQSSHSVGSIFNRSTEH